MPLSSFGENKCNSIFRYIGLATDVTEGLEKHRKGQYMCCMRSILWIVLFFVSIAANVAAKDASSPVIGKNVASSGASTSSVPIFYGAPYYGMPISWSAGTVYPGSLPGTPTQVAYAWFAAVTALNRSEQVGICVVDAVELYPSSSAVRDNEFAIVWTSPGCDTAPPWSNYTTWIQGTSYPFAPSRNLGSGCDCDGGEGGADESASASTGSSNDTMNTVGDPINMATGNEYQQEVDYASGEWLSFRRFYNSTTDVYPSAIGNNWRHSFDRSLVLTLTGSPPVSNTPATSALLLRPDGTQEGFIRSSSGVWAADSTAVADTITETDNSQGVATSYTVFIAAKKHFETYNTNGVLQSVTDEAGQGITLTYSTSSTSSSIAPTPGLLINVVDAHGRQLNLSYTSGGLLHQVTLPDGGNLIYGYDGNGNLTSVQYPDGTSRQYVYNESSLTGGTNLPSALTGVIDETSTRLESFTFDAKGRATSSSRAGNVDTTQLAYNYYTDGINESSSQVTYPLGAESAQYFDITDVGAARVGDLSEPCGAECGKPFNVIGHDSNGYPSETIDWNGNKSVITYDSAGNLDQQIDASGTTSQRTTTTTWNTALRVPLTRTVNNATGTIVSSTQWVYNAAGQALARCDIDPSNSAASGYSCAATGVVPAGVRRWTYTYCAAVDTVQCPVVGLMLTATGPRTDVTQTTTYSYYLKSSAVNCGTPGGACYQLGDLQTVTDAMGHSTTIDSYDADGRPTRTTDSNGVNTDMTYNSRGWLVSRNVGGALTQFTYMPYGAVHTVTDPDGIVTTYGYDAAHRLNKITDALGNYIQYTLDAAGNKTGEQVYDASGTLHKQLTRTFNALSEVTSIVDGLGNTVFSASASNSYDRSGNLWLSTDALGFQTKRTYDALNRLVQTIDNYGGTDAATQNTETAYQYDSLDRLTQVTDPTGFNTTYSYDGLGNPTSQVSPDTGTTSRTFDAAGNVLTKTDAKGMTATNTYDALDRLVSTSYADSAQNITYSYDDPNSTTSCGTSYPIGQLTRVIENTVTTIYCYDARGNVIQKRQILNGTTDTTNYGITDAGRISSIGYPSGTEVSYSRDADGRIQAIMITPSTGTASTAVSSVSYQPFGPVSAYTLGNGQQIARTYDANYRLTDLTSPAFNLHVARDAMGDITSIGNAPGANPATETYSYDPLYQLTAITEASGTISESVTYNQAGDRLTKTGNGLATGAYGYNPNTHQLVSTGNAARTVDADGNTTAISEAASVYGFGYSDRNRMVVAQLGGSTIASYTYNSSNERIQKVTGSSVERYDYDETSQMLSEYGVTNRDYIWMDGIPVANVDTSGSISTIAYVTADQLGTPRAIASSSGSTEWQLPYQGNPWNEATPTSAGYTYNLRFAGQYYDAETGLAYNVNRDYDATTGRYAQSDPIGLEGGPNTYSYADQSPLSFNDFSGNQAYARGPFYRGVSTIYCDGLGAIAIWLIEQNPCWDDCVKEHEGVHRADALQSNPGVCANQAAGTQVYLGSKADTYRSEVKAHDQELDCLRKKLAAMTWCDKCAKAIEDRIDREENTRAGYAYWLQQNPGQ